MSLILPAATRAAEAKRKIEAAQHKHRCGNCFFAVPHPTDLAQIECQGMPPMPLLVGMSAHPVTGEAQPSIMLFRPHLPKGLRCCALWEPAEIEGTKTQGPAN